MRSTRLSTGALQAKPVPAALQLDSDEDGDFGDPAGESGWSADADFEAPPERTGVRKTYIKAKPTTALNGFLTLLPAEVIVSILSTLDPPDLFGIARANKLAYSTVMTEGSGIWETVERRLIASGMPAGPEHLTFPQYAALVFANEVGCTTCGKSSRWQNGTQVWQCWKSFCHDCQRAHLVFDMAGEPVYGSDKTRAKIEAVTLSARFPRLDKRVPLIVPSGPLVVQHHRLHRAKGMYSVADLEAAEAWLQELDTKAQDVADRRLRKRIKQAGAAVAAAKRREAQVQTWRMGYRAKDDDSDNEMQARLFKEEVATRLTEAGHDPQAYVKWSASTHGNRMQFFGRTSGHYRPVLFDLTETNWRKLEQAILSWRAEPTQRRSKDLFQRIKIYRGYWSLPTGSLGGHLMSTMSPTVLCDLFEAAELYDLGNAVHLARMVDFYKTVRMALADVVRGPDQLHAGDEVVLAAPDALFACKHCGGITAWPAVFDHECDFIDDWAAEPVRVRILDHFEAAPAAICGLARDIASSYDDDSPSSPADLQALGAVFVLQPIARMKRKPQRFLAFLTDMASRNDLEDVADRVAIGELVKRSEVGADEDASGTENTIVYFCSTCDERGAFGREDVVWAHALDRHKTVALPSSDAILALAVSSWVDE